MDPEGWEEILDSITLVQTDTWHIARLNIDDMSTVERAARLLGDAELEGMVRAGEKLVDDTISSDHQEQSLVSNLASWVIQQSGAGGTGRAIPFDLFFLHKIINRLDAGVRMNHRSKAVMAVALSREAPRTPRDLVERALRHLIPRTNDEFNESLVSTFELISALCAHPDLIGRGAFPVDMLAKMFSASTSEAMSSLVLVWATANSSDSRVDESFREFATMVAKSAAPYVNDIDDAYLPVEAFEYLARPRSTEPTIDKHVINTLSTVATTAAHQVEPQIILDLLKRAQPHVPQSHVVHLASQYLSGRAIARTAEEEEKLSILRHLAQTEIDHTDEEDED
ncbi:hypothetical protein AB0E59_12200 [Lentzea sp. NPDC034063]|uniref:hypothetical protein n=1 Tax=unclassified Lentzea TaxID=2643253 RepID=UPI0034006385